MREPGGTSETGASQLREWMRRVMCLLDVAVGQLHDQEHPAQDTLLEAASLLRLQIDPYIGEEDRNGKRRLLAWQARKVRDYIDAHITEPLLVGDLCVLIRRSEAHFSRSFKRTFGESPHAFVIRRRLQLAARYMLQTDASLSDIALQCGFTDHAHLCKHFRQATGTTPSLWRRAWQAPTAINSAESDLAVDYLTGRIPSPALDGVTHRPDTSPIP